MKLAGTGLHPQLQGQVRLENFDATLPFSTPDDSISASSISIRTIRSTRGLNCRAHRSSSDYTIHVFVYGTANAPQAIFSSEPPLPQEEIISLLATGVTREELTGGVTSWRAGPRFSSGSSFTGRFSRKAATKSPNTDSIFNRLDVEFGNTDPRTGEQTATARYKVRDHIVLIGDIGVGGRFRGLVKYVDPVSRLDDREGERNRCDVRESI